MTKDYDYENQDCGMIWAALDCFQDRSPGSALMIDKARAQVHNLMRVKTAAAPALYAACEAHAAWFWAEQESPKSTTFDGRVELANYSEWLTAKALNRSAPEKYQGIPKMLIWPECRIHRGSAEEVRAIVDAVLDKYRAALAQLEVR